MMTRNEAAGSVLAWLFTFLLYLYFQRKTPTPEGGAGSQTMVSVSSSLPPTDSGSAVPVEITEDPLTGSIKLEEFRRLIAMSESADYAIPVVTEDEPTRQVAAEVIAPLAEQCQLDYLDALLLDIMIRAGRRTNEPFREHPRAA